MGVAQQAAPIRFVPQEVPVARITRGAGPIPRLVSTYHYLHADPIGRWLLAIVWAGLGCASAGVLALVPLMLERREVLAAAGCASPR